MAVKIKKISGSTIFDMANTIILTLFGFLMLYPVLWVISTSISDPVSLSKDTVKLLPLGGIQFTTYMHLFEYDRLWSSYINTIKYAFSGTFMALLLTSLAAYVLSIKTYKPRKVITTIFMLTMFFNGGMVPTYLLISGLNMLDTIWALILPPAMSIWYILILRTSFSMISDEIRESTRIDGAGEFRIYWQFFMPLSKATLAVIALFAAVSQWNSFFMPLLYLNDESRFPLTIFLRGLLITKQVAVLGMALKITGQSTNNMQEGLANGVSITIRMACIIVTILPIVFVYPFVQKYFVTGVMLGSVKG